MTTIASIFLLVASALEINGVTWTISEGAVVSGAVVTVRTDGIACKNAAITAKVDLTPYLADGIEWSVCAKGRGIAKPEYNWFGVKAMLTYMGADGKRKYPGPITKYGDFDWYKIRCRALLKDGAPGQGTFVLGLQEASGEVTFDLSTFRIASAKVGCKNDDPTWQCEYSPIIAARPCLRGVMSPSRSMNEADFRKLKSWGVTLLRYQMNRHWGEVDADQDLADYDHWLDGKLDHLESVVLPMAEKYGIKVVVDLHMPPGGKAWDGEMNLFHERKYAKHFVSCWLKIARRFRGHSVIYGYDLLNEPMQVYGADSSIDYWTLQAKTAERIRAIDPITPIIVESNRADSPDAFADLSVFKLKDVIYQVHLYAPMEFTHQGINHEQSFSRTHWPDESKGWSRDYLRMQLAPVRAFEQKHGAKIYVGEFSAVSWAEGAENYLADCIAVFNEYEWDWSYHAYGEFEGWSVEHAADKPWQFRPVETTPRKKVLLEGLSPARN